MIMEEKNDIIQSQLKAVDEMFVINYITGDNAVFEKTEGGFLSMSFNGEFYPRVQPYRAFPYISGKRKRKQGNRLNRKFA